MNKKMATFLLFALLSLSLEAWAIEATVLIHPEVINLQNCKKGRFKCVVRLPKPLNINHVRLDTLRLQEIYAPMQASVADDGIIVFFPRPELAEICRTQGTNNTKPVSLIVSGLFESGHSFEGRGEAGLVDISTLR